MHFPSHKLKYGGKVLLISFPNGNTYNCRHLNYGEYIVFNSLYQALTVPSHQVDELIAKTVVLDSIFQDTEWLNKQKAGLCKTISNLVMYMATNHYDQGDIDTFSQMLNMARHEARSIDNVMFTIICRIFPSYSFDSLKKLTYAEIIRLFANAERLMLDTGQIQEPFQFGNIDEDSPKQAVKSSQYKVNKEGKMVVPMSEVHASQALRAGDDDVVMAHDNEIKKMIKQHEAARKQVHFYDEDGQKAIKNRNKKLAEQMRRPSSNFSARKKKK